MVRFYLISRQGVSSNPSTTFTSKTMLRHYRENKDAPNSRAECMMYSSM